MKVIMKQFVLILLLTIGYGNIISSQNFSSLKDVKFEDSDMYEEYLDQVFDCCYYVVQTPYDKKDIERFAAVDFITRWSKGSPSHTIKVSDKVKLLFEEREDLLSVYSGCYLKIILELEENDANIVEEKAIESVIRYCSNDKNKLKMTKGMKELSSLKSSGEISNVEEYFAMTN